jgi:hypothetical protein
MDNQKVSRCPKGTRKNKKTGICEPPPPQQKTTRKKMDYIEPKYKPEITVKHDWDTIITKTTEQYNGKIYEYIVIPINTYVYRGFQYGDYGVENELKRGLITQEEYQEIKQFEKTEYKRKLDGLFFGNLGVACYYAFDTDHGVKQNHTVIEYITTKPIVLLDMSVWQNIKHVIDDFKNDEDVAFVFETAYGFDINEPTKTLERFSGATDDEMVELMLKWMKMKKTPKINGFGHSNIPGFHAEFTCIKQKGFLKKMNEYNQGNPRVPELVNIKKPTDKILLHAVTFDSGQTDIGIFNIGEKMF